MSRPIASDRSISRPSRYSLMPDALPRIDGNMPVRIVFMDPCDGAFPAVPPSLLSPSQAQDIYGFRLDQTKHLIAGESSASTTPASSATGVSAFSYRLANGSTFDLLATTVGFQWKTDGGSWAALTGTAFADVLEWDKFYFVGWGSKIIASNAVVGMYEIDPTLYTFTALTGTPVGPFSLAVFGNRVVAVRPTHLPGRLVWTAKNSNTDWTSLGSGYEDRLASGGGYADGVWSLWPMSENVALLVRERSIDVVETTGYFDAPFTFERIHSVGTPAPYTVAQIPGGIVMMTYDDFKVISTSEVRSIGRPAMSDAALHDWNSALVRPLQASGTYVAALNEYWVTWTDSASTGWFWRYNFDAQGWVRSNLPVGALAYKEGTYAVTFDSQAAQMNSSSTPLEYYGSQGLRYQGVWSVVSGTPHFIELYTTTSGTCSFVTGDIQLDYPDARVTVLRISVVYETRATGSKTLTITKMCDGEAWASHDTMTLPRSPTNSEIGTQTATSEKAITANTLRLKFSITDPGARFRIRQVVLDCVRGVKEFSTT